MNAPAFTAQSHDGNGRAENVNPFEGPFTIKRLAMCVAADMRLPLDEVMGKNRKRDFALARAIVYHFAHKKGISYPQIARAFNRDHSTILHGHRNLAAWLKLYPDAQAVFDRYDVLFNESKAHHAHIAAWKAWRGLPLPVQAAVIVPAVQIASKAELLRFRLAQRELNKDEDNRRNGSARLAEALKRAGGWR